MADIIQASLFHQIAIVLLLAGALGFAGAKLRQPLIVAFILTGIMIGPAFLGVVSGHSSSIDLLAELGIALLLFTVGLKLDFSLIRTLGPVALATGMGQMVVTGAIAFAICTAFGFNAAAAAYIAIALIFSSTIIIVKLLSDKNEIDSLHGRIALGRLIVEDVVVVIFMALLSAFGLVQAGSAAPLDVLLTVFAKGAALVAVVAFVAAHFATPMLRPMSRSPELLLTFVLGWATVFAALVEELGFSIELGGLLAGISLASTPFRDVIVARLSTLRDFMLLFFFVALGAKIDMGELSAHLAPAAVLSLITLLLKPTIIMSIMAYMGYKKRTSFFTGLTAAQVSEFSLVFIGMGVAMGHIGKDILGLVTLVALITISVSTYMITYSRQIYEFMKPALPLFERDRPHRHAEIAASHDKKYDVILFGLGRYGFEIIEDLLARGVSVLGLDFDPDAVRQARRREQNPLFSAAYGDVTDPEHALPTELAGVKWVICAIPHRGHTLQSHDSRLVMLEELKRKGFAGKTAVISHDKDETHYLKQRGVNLVLTPYPDAAQQAVREILG